MNGVQAQVLLVDDQVLIRAGISQLIAQIPGVEIVGEAEGCREALHFARTCLPDVVLMAEPEGLDPVAVIVSELPQVKVLILSAHASKLYAVKAVRAGAKGCITKNSDVTELELAIRLVMQGQTYLSPAIFKGNPAEPVYVDKECPPLSQLTGRQREVLRLMTEGNTTKEIAYQLKVSPKTVETHRAQLMARLGIRHMAGLVRYAIRTGLVPAEPPPVALIPA
jgi:DNA-binding NarL/FixJ family response regulator